MLHGYDTCISSKMRKWHDPSAQNSWWMRFDFSGVATSMDCLELMLPKY